jgi:nicotinamidase-related amidase
VVIDVNYDFVGHEPAPILESAAIWRNSCGEEGWAGVEAIATLLAAAREKSLPIFYSTSMEERPDALGRGLWRSSRNGEEAGVPGFVGSDIVAEIAPQERDVVLRKSKPSAFFGTGLISYLTELGVDTLLVTGTTTSGCVRATVVDAFSYNVNCKVGGGGDVRPRPGLARDQPVRHERQVRRRGVPGDHAGADRRAPGRHLRRHDRPGPAAGGGPGVSDLGIRELSREFTAP